MRTRLPKQPSMLDRVVQVLRTDVRQQAHPGARLATIATLAEQLGASTNTIRAALTILQQEGLVELRHGSGTYVCPRTATDKHVALLAEIDLLHPVTAFFHREMFRLLRDELLAAGHAVRLYVGTCVPGTIGGTYSTEAARQLLADLDRVSAVGAFLMLPDEPWVAPVQARGLPIVSNLPALGPAVASDRAALVRQAVTALAAQGRRAPALLAWGSSRPLAQPLAVDGSLEHVFATAAQAAGLTVREPWLCTTGNPSTPGTGWEAFIDLWRGTREKPDALVVTDDQLLPSLFEALHACGVRVPEQVLLVTHFTAGLPLVSPYPLIKLEYSPAAHAHALAELLRAALHGPVVGVRQVTLPHRLILPVGLAATAPPLGV